MRKETNWPNFGILEKKMTPTCPFPSSVDEKKSKSRLIMTSTDTVDQQPHRCSLGKGGASIGKCLWHWSEALSPKEEWKWTPCQGLISSRLPVTTLHPEGAQDLTAHCPPHFFLHPNTSPSSHHIVFHLQQHPA